MAEHTPKAAARTTDAGVNSDAVCSKVLWVQFQSRSGKGIRGSHYAPLAAGHSMNIRYNAALTALLAAALFGATTPLAKNLLGSLSPFAVAGLFYLGSGLGLAAAILVQRTRRTAHERQNESSIQATEIPWLIGAIAAGGVAGPALLMLGLTTTPVSLRCANKRFACLGFDYYRSSLAAM